MRPSERAIEAAIESLDAGAFQRLVEIYAAYTWPERFGSLAIRGRNSSGQTTAGWPDCFADRGADGVDAVEASRAAKWGVHFDEDTRKVDDLPAARLCGFLFVSWARTPSVRAQEVRRSAMAAKIGTELVTLVFRQQLVRELRRPRFARLWAEILMLASTAWPWIDIRDAPVYGGPGPASFVPTRAEFEAGSVTTPAASELVVDRLARDGWCLIQGRGGSGKTMLALALAYRSLANSCVVYYLDLAAADIESDAMNSRSALEAVAERADERVMFVLDNVHRASAFALTLKRHWESLPDHGDLLLLARIGEHAGHLRGLASPLAALEQGAVVLRVDSRVLRGVATRLSRRAGLDLAPPSNTQVRRWGATFGGDLIAFSAALSSSMRSQDPWNIVAADARGYVADRYLSGLGASERAALLRVADLSALELPAPPDVIPEGQLSLALAEGFVVRTTDGYRTAHPGLGELLLAAAGSTIGDYAPQALLEATQADRSTLLRLASRLAGAGNLAAARGLLTPLVQTSTSALEVLTVSGAAGLPQQSRMLDAVLGAETVDALVTQDETAVASFVHRATLSELAAFRREAIRSFPLTAAAFDDAIVHADIDGLAREVERLTARRFSLFLRQCRRVAPIRSALLDQLASSGAIDRFVGAGPRGTLRGWKEIVGAIDASPPFAAAFRTAISEHPSAFTAMLVAKPGLASIVEIANRRPVSGWLVEEHLRREGVRNSIATSAEGGGPRRLVAILEYAHAHDRQLLEAVEITLTKSPAFPDTVAGWRLSAPKSIQRLTSMAATSAPMLHALLS